MGVCLGIYFNVFLIFMQGNTSAIAHWKTHRLAVRNNRRVAPVRDVSGRAVPIPVPVRRAVHVDGRLRRARRSPNLVSYAVVALGEKSEKAQNALADVRVEVLEASRHVGQRRQAVGVQVSVL